MSSFPAFVLVAAALPWVYDFDPLSRFFSLFLPPLLRKLMASVSFAPMVGLAAIFDTLILLTLMPGMIGSTAVQRLNLRLSTNMQRGFTIGQLQFKEIIETNESKFDKMITRMLSWSKEREIELARARGERQPINLAKLKRNMVFRDRFNLHNQHFLLITMINDLMSVYIPNIQGIILMYCIVANVGVIRLHDKEPAFFILYFLSTSIAFFIANLLVLGYAANPYEISCEVIRFWKGENLGHVEQKQLKSMQIVSLNMGKFFKIRKASGMNVLDTVFDATVSAVTLEN